MGEKKIGIALGSGSSRGWAHIGVLNCLEDRGIKVDCVSGTSIGAYVGVIHAAGDLKRLNEFVLNMDRRTVLAHIDVTFPKSGFLDGKHFPDLVKACTDAEDFSDLKLPVLVTAADILSGKEHIFREGSIFEAIRASGSVPGVLTPYKLGKKLLIDGGVINPVPVDLCRELGADVCIAVDLNAGLRGRRFHDVKQNDTKKERFKVGSAFLSRFGINYDLNNTAVVKGINHWLNPEDQMPNILDIMGASLEMMESRIAEVNMALHKPDILIKPELGHLRMFDFDKGEESIEEGYRKMEAALPALEKFMS